MCETYTTTIDRYDDTEHHFKTYNSGTYHEYDIYHRVNGPAFIAEDEWEWFIDGQLHRYYGPAAESGEWWLRNDKIK